MVVRDFEVWKESVEGLLKRYETSFGGDKMLWNWVEVEMATHSSVLAWRIPGTGEPIGLPSMCRLLPAELQTSQGRNKLSSLCSVQTADPQKL